jgi:hypothetical protein
MEVEDYIEEKESANINSTIVSEKLRDEAIVRFEDDIEKSVVSSSDNSNEGGEPNNNLANPFMIKARNCDSPYDIILADKRRSLFSIFSEIQVFFFFFFFFFFGYLFFKFIFLIE